MSLVIGHRTPGGGVVLVGDTRVWHYALERPGTAEESCSKLMIFGSNLAVGFAGELSSAIDPALRSLPADGDAGKLVDLLTKASRDGGFGCVVGLYATAPWESDDREAVLSSVKLMKIERGEKCEVDSAFVGSREGFRLAQGLLLGERHANLERNEEALRNRVHFSGPGSQAGTASTPGEHLHAHLIRLRAAMDEVIRAEEIPDVGDYMLEVTATAHGFRYAANADFFVEGPAHFVANTNILPRTAKDGGFTPVRLEGHAHGHLYGQRFPAIYFLQGGFGYLYHSKDRSVPRAHLVRGTTVRDFVERCRADDGVLLHGVGVGPEGVFAVDAHAQLLEEFRDRLRSLAGQPVVIWKSGAIRPDMIIVDNVDASGVVHARRVTVRNVLSSMLPFLSPSPPGYLRLDLVDRIEDASDYLKRALWKRR